jgi:hypothetical protein
MDLVERSTPAEMEEAADKEGASYVKSPCERVRRKVWMIVL